MQCVAGREPGRGRDLATRDSLGEYQAGQTRFAVDQYRAGAAGALAAAEFRREIADAAAEHVEQVLAVGDEHRLFRAVEMKLDRLARHHALPCIASRRRRCTPATSRRYQPDAMASVRRVDALGRYSGGPFDGCRIKRLTFQRAFDRRRPQRRLPHGAIGDARTLDAPA